MPKYTDEELIEYAEMHKVGYGMESALAVRFLELIADLTNPDLITW